MKYASILDAAESLGRTSAASSAANAAAGSAGKTSAAVNAVERPIDRSEPEGAEEQDQLEMWYGKARSEGRGTRGGMQSGWRRGR